MRFKFLVPALNLAATSIVFSITPITARFLALGLALMLLPFLIVIRLSLFKRTIALWRYHLPAAVIACIGMYIVQKHLPAGGIPALNLPYAVLLYVSFACLVMAWIQWLVAFALQAWGLVQFICAFASALPGPAKKKES